MFLFNVQGKEGKGKGKNYRYVQSLLFSSLPGIPNAYSIFIREGEREEECFMFLLSVVLVQSRQSPEGRKRNTMFSKKFYKAL